MVAVIAAANGRTVFALGSGITLLGVLRALSEAKVDVFALPDIDGLPRRSRWYRPGPSDFSGVNGGNLLQRLESLPDLTVLMPCSDFWVRAVAALPSAVRAHYPASVAPLEALELLVDKARFGGRLDRLGLPHPATRPLSSPADFDQSSDAQIKTSFLKPAHSQEFFARFGVKAFRFDSRAQAIDLLTTCSDGGFGMLLQEYIPGPPTSHYFIDGFVDRNGVIRALFARQRLRMSPPDFGNSTLMVSVPVDQVGDGARTLQALFEDIRYRGIFSAEFKRDLRDGLFKLIEVNARPWWYVEFAARCGVNVCELAVRDALGEPVKTITRYALGRRCVFPYYDLQAVRAELSAGRLGLLGWARSWVGPYQPIFRWSDPLPALGEIAARIGRRFRRGLEQ